MTGSVDTGIDKAKILAEIGVAPLPAPPPAPAPASAPPAARSSSVPAEVVRRAAPERPAAPPPPPAARRRRRLPALGLVGFRTEAAALLTGFVALLWLSVGVATSRAIPLLVGSLFLAAALAAGVERWLGKKP
jgi:hypothetical protein